MSICICLWKIAVRQYAFCNVGICYFFVKTMLKNITNITSKNTNIPYLYQCCYIVFRSITSHFPSHLNLRSFLPGGWRHGHGATRYSGKDLHRKRKDLHWQWHQARKTVQYSLYFLYSCSHFYTCDCVSWQPLYTCCPKWAWWFLCYRARGYLLAKKNKQITHVAYRLYVIETICRHLTKYVESEVAYLLND